MTPAGGTIDFSLSDCPCIITLTSGELFIDKDITVKGPGANLLTISAGENPFRVIRIEGPPGLGHITVKIDGIRIADGRGGTEEGPSLTVGGGIFNLNADTTIANSIIANNRASSGGGAVNRTGVLRLVASSVVGNSGHGGGIRTVDGTVIVSDSRFTDNQSWTGLGSMGGAILSDGSLLSVYNTTFTRNSGVYFGGVALWNNSTAEISNSSFYTNESGIGTIGGSGTVNMVNSTISGNAGGSVIANGRMNITSCTIVRNYDFGIMGGEIIPGGVIVGTGGDVTVRNSIIAENESGDIGHLDSGTLIKSGGYNLVGDPRNFAHTFTQTGDLTGTAASPRDPMLLPLADNGGFTQTHRLRLDSPAVDSGFAFGENQDQLGAARSRDFDNIENVFGGDGTDIGAAELVIDEWISGRVVTPDGRGLRGARVSIIHLSGRVEYVLTSSLGYYSFPAMLADGVHLIRVQGSKRYRFESYVHDFTGDATAFEFRAFE